MTRQKTILSTIFKAENGKLLGISISSKMKEAKMKSSIVLLGCLSMFASALIAQDVHSQQRSSVLLNNDILVIKTEGISFLGSGITEADAKIFAINDAKRNALDQAGTYLESHTTVLNHQLVKDEIITFSAGLLKSKVLKEERTLINNMFAFKVNILAVIDTKLLNQRIEEIRKDNKLKKQLEAERERSKQLEAQILELQTSGKMATKQKTKILTNKLKAAEWYEKAEKNMSGYNSKLIDYNKAIEFDPQYANAYNARGFAFWVLGDSKSAIRDANRAIEINSHYADAYNLRAYLFEEMGDYKSAIQDFNRVIEINPQSVDAYSDRGEAFAHLHDYNSAIQNLNKAVELNPLYSDQRGKVFLDMGDYDSAIRDFNKTIELYPENAGAYGGRGLAFLNLGKYNLAIQDFNKIIALNYQLAKSAAESAAEPSIRKVLGLSSEDDISEDEALDYALSSDRKVPIVTVRDIENQAKKSYPQYAAAYYNRGLAYYKLGKYGMASQNYNSYLRINGNKDGDAEKVRQMIRDMGYTPQY